MQPNLNNKYMKQFIAIFLTLTMEVFTFMSYAEEKTIEATKKHWLEDRRSVSCIPTITHDNNIFHIYSDIIIENLHITVRDATGMIFYSDIVTVSNVQRYSLIIDNIEEGNYIIELNHEDKYLYGYFNISL